MRRPSPRSAPGTQYQSSNAIGDESAAAILPRKNLAATKYSEQSVNAFMGMSNLEKRISSGYRQSAQDGLLGGSWELTYQLVVIHLNWALGVERRLDFLEHMT